VLFAYTENSRIENVTAANNDYSIYLSSSSNNALANNNASNNRYGIRIHSSSGNTLYHNNLINDYQNADDSGTNAWDSGSTGNYYSDYTGTDPDGDGIGNDPYDIPGGTSIDHYPLMQPWTGGTQLLGDLNRDDRISPADAAIALQLAATGAQNPAADVSGDGQITSLDALMILQSWLGGSPNYRKTINTLKKVRRKLK
jgi:parallel beta-helix repeat protein